MLLCMIALQGCVQKWYVEILSYNDLGPTLCFSFDQVCGDKGVKLNTIAIDRLGQAGERIEPVWLIQFTSSVQSDSFVHRLKYGIPPEGWVELMHAKSLVDDCYYSINEEYYFRRDNEGRYFIYSRKEFFDRLQK